MTSNVAYLLIASGIGLHSQVEIDANNLVNSQTVGYEADSLLYTPKEVKESPRKRLTFAVDKGTTRDLKAGDLEPTHKPLDVAISGDGYFALDTPYGMRLTKAGNFTINSEGLIASSNGYPVLSRDGQPMGMPPNVTEILIGQSGLVATPEGEIGQIGVFTVPNPRLLVKVGGNMLMSQVDVPEPVGEGDYRVLQGFLQHSNTSSVIQTARVMETTRAFEMNTSMQQSTHRLRKDAVAKLMAKE